MAGSPTPANKIDPHAIAALRLTLTERSPDTQKYKLKERLRPSGTHVRFVDVKKFVREVTKADRCRGELRRKSEAGFLQPAVSIPDDRNVGESFSRCARLGQSGLPGYRIARSEVHAQLITQARNEALRIMKDNPGLKDERGEALRVLRYLFERDEAVPLIGAG